MTNAHSLLKSGRIFVFLFFVAASLFLFPSAFAFKAELDKIVYVTNSTLTISGTTDYNVSVSVNVSLYNASGTGVGTFGSESDAAGDFSSSYALTDFIDGIYSAVVSQNYTNNLTLYFRVVQESLFYRVFIIDSSEVYAVNTSTTVNSGSDFSDLLSTSLSSGTVKYGNMTLEGLLYHFVLTDPDTNDSYTKVYVDDDRNFSLYDNQDDTSGLVEKTYKKRDIAMLNATGYLVAGIDTSGSKLLLAKAVNTSSFSIGQIVYYAVVSENAQGQIVGNKALSIDIISPNGTETSTVVYTDENGSYVGNLSLASVGTYLINVNDGQGIEFVNVESFKINTKITDLSDNPATSFLPGDTARIKTTAKANSNLIDLTSINVSIFYPNGTSVIQSMTNDTSGIYYYDFDIPSNLEGSYSVRISATYSGETQTNLIGFAAESTSFQMFAINTEYLDEVQQGGDGVFIEAFAPGKNVSIMAAQSDLSAGGFMGGGEGGAIDIEANGINCSNAVEVLEIKDDKDKTYTLSLLGIMVRSIENLSQSGFLPPEANPPEGMMKQCMIIITNSSSLPNGFYQIKAKLKTSGTEKISSASFSMQRLLASGYTVDKNAEGFGFFSPNGTVNIKVKLTDMLTNEDLNGSQILSAKIIEMSRDFPSYADVLSQMSGESYNSSIGVLSFTSPSSEGFYSMRFRFKANVSGAIYEGEGKAFFELKKYIIFAEPESNAMGPSFKKPDENITLRVYIADIDKGSLFDIGFEKGSSQLSCTGCSGFMVNVTRLFNEQLFREVSRSNYEITEGNILNSTSGATVYINHAQELDSGFYRVELQVYNPSNTNESYTGWGFFEIRSFFVQAQKATWNGSLFEVESNTENMGGKSEMQFETGSPAYILIGAMVPGPNGPEPLNISSASIVNVLKMTNNGPPITVNYTGNITQRATATERCENGNCTTVIKPGRIANISIPGAVDGTYIINIRVTTVDGDSDISTTMVTFASFMLEASYRGSSSWWDPLYSSNELFNITFTGSTFDSAPHNLSFAKPNFIFNDKKGRPVKISGNVWNSSTMTNCVANTCNVLVNLSSFTPGRYKIDFIVNDTDGNEQTTVAMFEVRNVVFSIPQLLQSFNWRSDTGDTGTITLNDNQDRCDNTVWLRYDMNENLLKYSPLINSTESADSIGNETYFIFNDGSRTWNISLTEKPGNTITAAHICMDGGMNMNIHDGLGNCPPGENSFIILMNSTVAIIGSSDNLVGEFVNISGSWVKQGVISGINLAIVGVGYNSNGEGNYIRVGQAGNYSKFYPQGGDLGSPGFMYIPSYYKTMVGNIFCVAGESVQNEQPRSWRDIQNSLENGTCRNGFERVFAFSNGSTLWLSTHNDNNLSGGREITLSQNVTNEIVSLNWSLASLNITSNMQNFRIKLSDNRICGQSWECGGQGPCQPTSYELYAPQQDSKFVFGRINLIQSPWQINQLFGNKVNSSRHVYVYHNRTALFMSADGDFRANIGYPIGGIISDPYGGSWTVKSLSDSGLSLIGRNTLANLGSYVNMSLSQSGIVRFGELRESDFGYFSKEGGRSGIDLDNDGFTNGTSYYILTDANIAGVYDTFFFSSNNNFTNPISISENQTTRTFINNAGGTLTLLSIDPRADRVLFYTSEIGDWSDLGDLATTGNIRVPFIVQQPNGDPVSSVTLRSIGAYYENSQSGRQYINFPIKPEINIVGQKVGEITLNRTLTGYNFSTGQYLFEIEGNTSSEQFKLEEWKWPRVNLRAYLTTEKLGKGGWINNFSNLTYTPYGEKSGIRGIEVYQVNLSRDGLNGDGIITAVVENARNRNTSACGFVAPAGVNASQAEIHESQPWQINNPMYYFYFSMNQSDGNKVWVKGGDCNFTDADSYELGDYVNLTQGNSVLMLQILAMNSTNYQNGPYALIGINISDTDVLKPVRTDQMDSSMRWRLVGVNISGNILNVLFTNTSTNPMCSLWGWECVSGAVITRNGNYNSATPLAVGDNLSSVGLADLYISSLGPNSWDGISLSNSSGLAGMQKPVFANIFVQDSTPLKIKYVSESNIEVDLNKDGDLTDSFYILLVDDVQDGQQQLTRIIVDGDNEITPMWESQGQGDKTYYDYSGNETGITEQWGSLPTAIWSGNLDFGPEQENESYRRLPWEQKASWEVILLDNDRILIGKETWCGISANDTLKVFLRAYQFNQTNIQNANVSLSNVFKFGFMGGGVYSSSNYNATNPFSDNTGYAILTITPNGQWETGGSGSDYLFRILVKDSQNATATTDRYARIGAQCQW